MTNTQPTSAAALAAALGVTETELAALDAAGREFIAQTDAHCDTCRRDAAQVERDLAATDPS